jgi:Fic family protein
MRTLNYKETYRKLLTPEIVSYLAQIHEQKGQQNLFIEAHKDALTELLEIAKIQSTEASNRIEGIITTDDRLKKIVRNKTAPRNRNEREIAGYRDVLATIHENYDFIPVRPNMILQLHRDLYKFNNPGFGGNYKNSDNIIAEEQPDGTKLVRFQPVPAWETPEAVETLCNRFNDAINDPDMDPLLLMPIFILDFLCIHPFNDGNGRMSRLLTTLLLYRSGFCVGKYISLEAKISKDKDLYYAALAASQTGWHEGKEDVVPFIKYLLGTILAAYRDFADRFALVETKRSALETVRFAAQSKIGRFTKQDIRNLCPALSLSSVEGALRKLVEAGELKREGNGKNTCYYRV